jgi:phosphoribosylaminoimidazole carboxylase (NCAIR synthetase)
MKSILILGAGLMQKPAIVSSKKLGLKVYVVDADSNAICVSDADVFMKIDLKDKESILEYAKK